MPLSSPAKSKNHNIMGAFKGESIRSLRRRLSNTGSVNATGTGSLLDDIQEAEKLASDTTSCSSGGSSSSVSSVEHDSSHEEEEEQQQQQQLLLLEQQKEQEAIAAAAAAAAAKNKQQADAVRLRLLNKLGISAAANTTNNNGGNSANGSSHSRRHSSSTTLSLLPIISSRPKEVSYQIPLNDGNDDNYNDNNNNRNNKSKKNRNSTHTKDNQVLLPPLAFAPSTTPTNNHTPTSTTTTTTPTTTLNFHPIVTVHPIPSHRAYSSRIRRTVWTSARELHDAVERNCEEFAAEGWTVEGVLDEDQLIRGADGSLIHPVHFPPPRDEMEGFAPLRREKSLTKN
eukprot:scaffold5479_cov199-Amphora_coffeaeformis.AAC.70